MSRGEVEKIISEKLHELSQWKESHQFASLSMRSGTLQKLCSDLNQKAPLLGPACFAPVKEFLQGAGQAQLVSQVRFTLPSISSFICSFVLSTV